MEAIILSTDDGEYEGLYIDGKLVAEDEKLGMADVPGFWLKIAEDHKVGSADLKSFELNAEDSNNCYGFGGLPQKLTDFVGEYQ